MLLGGLAAFAWFLASYLSRCHVPGDVTTHYIYINPTMYVEIAIPRGSDLLR